MVQESKQRAETDWQQRMLGPLAPEMQPKQSADFLGSNANGLGIFMSAFLRPVFSEPASPLR
jgi:hypothetical protein